MPKYKMLYTGDDLVSTVTFINNSIANEYDEQKVYAIGSIILYQGKLYTCILDDVTGTFLLSNWAEILIFDNNYYIFSPDITE